MKPGIDFPLYEGYLTTSPKAKRAHQVFYDQKARCYNKKHKWYKYWGGKGIDQEYTCREFVSWWVFNLKTFKGKWPTVGRIDHSKNYSFDNIIMQDMSENCKESAARNDFGRASNKKVYVYSKSRSHIATFCTQGDAAKFFGIHNWTIKNIIKGKKHKKVNFILTGEII